MMDSSENATDRSKLDISKLNRFGLPRPKCSRAIYLLLLLNAASVAYSAYRSDWRRFTVLYFLAIVLPPALLVEIRYALNNNQIAESYKTASIDRYEQPFSFWFTLVFWSFLYCVCLSLPFLISGR